MTVPLEAKIRKFRRAGEFHARLLLASDNLWTFCQYGGLPLRQVSWLPYYPMACCPWEVGTCPFRSAYPWPREEGHPSNMRCGLCGSNNGFLYSTTS